MSPEDPIEPALLLGLTRDIVSAYVSAQTVSPDQLPLMIAEVYAALEHAPNGTQPETVVEVPIPAIDIEASVTQHHIICLEDGLPFKSLKRHLRSKYNMTPEEYREKWGLPEDYPMVAPDYAKERSRIAKQSGLGRKAT